ncbi:MAG: hypothetical protein NTV46_18885, partial [Verrucomicrobia bacterium]|nr:hypothetical protein [Verrucomicrobiota bacterium]
MAGTLGTEPLRVGAHLTDGSFIIGIPTTSALSVMTSYGRITLPLEAVARIRLASDRETAVFEMRKGDQVTGVIDGHGLVLETAFGKTSIEMNLVLHIKVYPASPPRAISTKPTAMAPAGAVWAGEDKPGPQLQLELSLVGGSRVVGTPGIDS